MDNEFKNNFALIFHISPDFENIFRLNNHKWDSMKHAELIITMQKTYGVRFSLNEIMQISSASQLYELIQQKKSGN